VAGRGYTAKEKEARVVTENGVVEVAAILAI
jgi:hypothetical protein